VSDLYDQYRALRFRTEAERLRAAAADLHSPVIRSLVISLANDYDSLATRVDGATGEIDHSNDD
jgi:hypothetical protein